MLQWLTWLYPFRSALMVRSAHNGVNVLSVVHTTHVHSTSSQLKYMGALQINYSGTVHNTPTIQAF